MNWYKKSSLIDNIQVSRFSGDTLVLLIAGKRYEYNNVPGHIINETIETLKRMPNKFEAGRRLNTIIQNINDKIAR